MNERSRTGDFSKRPMRLKMMLQRPEKFLLDPGYKRIIGRQTVIPNDASQDPLVRYVVIGGHFATEFDITENRPDRLKIQLRIGIR